MAFGGGALLSAVVLVLVPEGIAHLELLSASVFFIAGGLFFMFLDLLGCPRQGVEIYGSSFTNRSLLASAAASTFLVLALSSSSRR